jgi:hypothetical protein
MKVKYRPSESFVDEAIVREVLDYYGVEITMERRQGWVDGFCPTHTNVNTPAFSINVETGVSICRSVCGVRSFIKLVADIEGCSDEQAKEIILRFKQDKVPKRVTVQDLSKAEFDVDRNYLMALIEGTLDGLLYQVLDEARRIVQIPEDQKDEKAYMGILLLDDLAGSIMECTTLGTYKVDYRVWKDSVGVQRQIVRWYAGFHKDFMYVRSRYLTSSISV